MQKRPFKDIYNIIQLIASAFINLRKIRVGYKSIP